MLSSSHASAFLHLLRAGLCGPACCCKTVCGCRSSEPRCTSAFPSRPKNAVLTRFFHKNPPPYTRVHFDKPARRWYHKSVRFPNCTICDAIRQADSLSRRWRAGEFFYCYPSMFQHGRDFLFLSQIKQICACFSKLRLLAVCHVRQIRFKCLMIFFSAQFCFAFCCFQALDFCLILFFCTVNDFLLQNHPGS